MKPKVLFIDIETAPALAHIYQLGDQHVSHSQLERDCFILSWAAKWQGSDKLMYMDQDRKSTRLNSSHMSESRMPSSA